MQHQWHTLTKTGKVAVLNKLNPGPFVEVNPQDGAALGLQPGDGLEVRSRRGRAVLPVLVSDRMHTGSVFAPFHWNDVFGDELTVNQITSPAVDALSLQPEYKVCAVALARVPATPYALAPLDAFWGASAPEPDRAAEERLSLHGDGLNRAGILERPARRVSQAENTSPPVATVLYASQTGTAEGYAREAARRLGTAARAMDDVSPAALSGIVLFFASTFGDGDVPDNGAQFWRALAAEDAPRLAYLRFGVLAFGDSSYAEFCGFGAKLSARLTALGAEALLPRENCEPGEDGPVQDWLLRRIRPWGVRPRLSRRRRARPAIPAPIPSPRA